jgi:hypothetical protein
MRIASSGFAVPDRRRARTMAATITDTMYELLSVAMEVSSHYTRTFWQW